MRGGMHMQRRRAWPRKRKAQISVLERELEDMESFLNREGEVVGNTTATRQPFHDAIAVTREDDPRRRPYSGGNVISVHKVAPTTESCVCPPGATTIPNSAGKPAPSYETLEAVASLQASTNIEIHPNIFLNDNFQKAVIGRSGRGKGGGKGGSRDYAFGRRGHTRERGATMRQGRRELGVAHQTRRRRKAYKHSRSERYSSSAKSGKGGKGGKGDSSRDTFSGPLLGACECITPDGNIVAGRISRTVVGDGISSVDDGGLEEAVARGTISSEVAANVPAVPAIIPDGVLFGGRAPTGIFVFDPTTGTVQEGTIPGLFTLTVAADAGASGSTTQVQNGLIIAQQSYFLNQATVVQTSPGTVQITGVLEVPTGSSGSVISFQQVTALAKSNGGSNYRFALNRRRLKSIHVGDPDDNNMVISRASRQKRQLQVDQAVGFVYGALITNNPVLSPFGSLTAQLNGVPDARLGMAG